MNISLPTKGNNSFRIKQCNYRYLFKLYIKATFILGFAYGTFFQFKTHFKELSKTTGGAVFRITSSKLVVDFAYKDLANSILSLGPHKITVFVEESCKNPGLWIRLEGDALVSVMLYEDDGIWSGSFSLPIEGKYSLRAHWYGCDRQESKKVFNLVDVQAEGVASSSEGFYPSSSWISSKKIPFSGVTQPYIWHDPNIPPTKTTLLKVGETMVTKEGTVGQRKGFYLFRSLTNYELVCWIGSKSSESLRESFLALLPLIFNSQRPFKFHYYHSQSFVKPDADWNIDQKEKFRKCKHVLVSLDEPKGSISQEEYSNMVEKFLLHLVKAIPDKTFPIWMFTVFETPTKAKLCHSPFLQRTSNHPCNDALKALFDRDVFPSRVQLLDGTDVTLPLLDENEKDAIAVLALRIYVFIGKQVEMWRASGQTGKVNGLVRGDKVEPNFKLTAYNGW